jgi:hypothetical protein
MALMTLENVEKVLDRYGTDAIESMNKFLDENGIENLQKSMAKKTESKYPVSILTVQMSHYGEYIDSGSKYTTKFPPPDAISRWCDRRGLGDGTTDKNGFNKATYPVSLKIFKNGIKAKPFLHLFEDLYPWYEDMFAEALSKDVVEQFKQF